jgi:hypothetical protein
MPHQIKFGYPPAGYAASSRLEGETVSVVSRQFLSSEDGMVFIGVLEDFVNPFLKNLPSPVAKKPSQIDHMLLHFDRDGNGVIYINELSKVGRVQFKKTFGFEVGQIVQDDDIVDFTHLEFEGINVPEDHGVLFLFSQGWRKGLYFDFEPTSPQGKARGYDLSNTLGQYYNYVASQELHSISDEIWAALFNEKWFPFIGLSIATIKGLLGWVKSGYSADQILPEASSQVKSHLQMLRQAWNSRSEFAEHKALLDIAAERFEAQDWVSANSILYTRLEGILRSVNLATGTKQSDLASAPASLAARTVTSRILPAFFERYLNEVYFASFDPNTPANISISRNSVGHGVAPMSEFSEKAAVIGFLIVEQIFYHLPEATAPIPDES